MKRRIDIWIEDRLDKLERRLRHHRDLGESLAPDSVLKLMNDRAVLDMETKLFKLRLEQPGSAQTGSPSSIRGSARLRQPSFSNVKEPTGRPAAPRFTRAAQ